MLWDRGVVLPGPVLRCRQAWGSPSRCSGRPDAALQHAQRADRQCADDVCANLGGAGIVSIEIVSVLMGGTPTIDRRA